MSSSKGLNNESSPLEQKVVAPPVAQQEAPATLVPNSGEKPIAKHGLQSKIWVKLLVTFLAVGGTVLGVVKRRNSNNQKNNSPTASPTVAPTNFPTMIMTPTIREEYLLDILDEKVQPFNVSDDWWFLFNDTLSPQRQALSWMVHWDAFSSHPENIDSQILVERFALAVLYFSTSGPSWYDSLEHQHVEFLEGSKSVCEWNGDFFQEGAFCYIHEDNPGLVTSLYLVWAELSGTIPWEISFLDNLQDMVLQNNDALLGTIPPEIGRLSSLKYLAMDMNGLTGPIPPEISLLTNLGALMLAYNSLSGSIPKEFGELSQLKALQLEFNSLSGPIPKELSQLTLLQALVLQRNLLSGTIPTEIGQLSALERLWLPTNALTGYIPSEISQLDSLRELFLNSNGLSGSIPAQIAQLTSLTYLSLNENGLTGQVPPVMPASLRNVYLGNNHLSGSMSSEWSSSMPFLSSLSLDGNGDIHGSIPSEIGQWKYLHNLMISGNDISGIIPTEIGLLSSMVRLLLDGNSLTGPLPSEIGNLQFLKYLSLNGNSDLTGSVPTEYGGLDQLETLDISSTSLTGSLDSIICADYTRYFSFLSADCLGPNPEVECSCCTSCCIENGQEDYCEDM